MSPKIPAPLSELAAQLGKLPGMGPKSAMRIVMTLLAWPEERTRLLGKSISELRDRLHVCSRCGGLATSEVCAVCADPERSQETLCLVADWDSMMTLDSGGFYRGQYLILGGLLNPLEHRDSGSLDQLAGPARGQDMESAVVEDGGDFGGLRLILPVDGDQHGPFKGKRSACRFLRLKEGFASGRGDTEDFAG